MEVTQGAPFESFGLSEATMRAIRNKHYTVSTPVQAGCIPPMLAGKDVIAKAPTGTGKTMAFGIPIIERAVLFQKRMKRMKKWMILAAAVVLAAPVFAQTQEAFPSYIQVNGRSQMEVTPDEFYLSIVINERESKGKITVETQQRQMIDALKKLGVDVEKQLKVANMSSDFYKKASSLTTAKYQLLLHSAAEVGDVTAALGDLGISNVGIVRVTRSDIDSLKEQVRLDAIHNAKSSAEALAGAIGQKIGKCFYIYDSNYDVAPQYYDNMMMVRSKAMMADSAEAGAPEEPSLDFKTIKLEYNVQTKFVLE